MHIQLLPATLPPERSLTPTIPRIDLAPGQRVTATVLSPDLDGRSMLALAGREAASRTPLPFPPGTRLLLEVVESAGDEPHMRLVEPRQGQPVPPVSSTGYGYAAAVLAATGATPAVTEAARALAGWLPVLVSRGLLTPAQAAALGQQLGPLAATARDAAAPGETRSMPDSELARHLADALATRLARDPSLLEARLAYAARHAPSTTDQQAVDDLRGRLAALARSLADPPADAALEGARASVRQVQDALLAEQARTAAHLVRDGVLDLRVPMALGAHDVDVHLRTGEAPDAPPGAGEAGGRRVQLDLTLEGLGRIQVRLDAFGPHLRAELVTEQAAAADAIERRLADLVRALTSAGFSEVSTRVAIDPVRVVSADTPFDVPPEGSIVNVDA